MYTFISLNNCSNPFFDNIVLPKVKILLDKYKNVLADDYSSESFDDLLNRVFPHFYVSLKDGVFLGFVYLADWTGGNNRYHSCTMTVCIEKEFWGRTSREVSRIFISKIFKYYKLYKLKALVFEYNRNVVNFLLSLGFKYEANLKGETFKNGKPANMLVYSVFRDNYKE